MTNQQVSLDPRLCHLDHISTNAYVAAGNGLSSFSGSGKSQGVIARVDVCNPLSAYADPTNAEVGVPSGSANCATDYSWAWKSTSSFHEMFGYVATSPDGTYVLAAGVKETSNGVHARWIMKLDAVTGAEIWSIVMPTDNSDGLSSLNQSGYESVAFTADGGFIAGGWGNHEGGWPSFKSGGQVEFGVPIFQKFSASVASQSTAFASPPTPEWTFKCDSTNCDATAKGSMKTIRVVMDNGVEKVVSAPGNKAHVIVVNAADGTKSAYKAFSSFQGSFQDIEPLMSGGAIVGYGVTGLESSTTVPSGTGGCTKAEGCATIFGHVALISTDLSTITWKKTFNDFTGGTGAYAGLTPISDAVMITECWGLTATVDAQGDGTGFVAACGQGIEGCREYLTGIDEATLTTCENDPRRTWRGAAVKVDTSGTMNWWRNDNERAYEFVDRDASGQLVLLSDKPIGFGFATLAQ